MPARSSSRVKCTGSSRVKKVRMHAGIKDRVKEHWNKHKGKYKKAAAGLGIAYGLYKGRRHLNKVNWNTPLTIGLGYGLYKWHQNRKKKKSTTNK